MRAPQLKGALLPVTARLSRKFYERFGDEIATEFVDWFNAVDSTYQQQLRELNDLNWERFKATLDARVATLDARFAALDARFAALDARFAALDARFTGKLSETKSDLMKWMFIYWSGTVVTIGGLLIALFHK
jgi:hypothetical protein